MEKQKDDLILKKMDELCDRFELYVDRANSRGRPDSPASHFHIKTISRLKTIGLKAVFDDGLFFDYLYATLATWGMASRRARLAGFHSFVDRICGYRQRIMELGNQSLALLSKDEDTNAVITVIQDIWEVLPNMRVSETKSQLVAGSKTLHHLLPDLVPPIDKKYTLGFFELKTSEQKAFLQVFVNYLYIYERTADLINHIMRKNPLNSSVTKAIDNAIIGYQSPRTSIE